LQHSTELALARDKAPSFQPREVGEVDQTILSDDLVSSVPIAIAFDAELTADALGGTSW
jgi:hypothetical protein